MKNIHKGLIIFYLVILPIFYNIMFWVLLYEIKYNREILIITLKTQDEMNKGLYNKMNNKIIYK